MSAEKIEAAPEGEPVEATEESPAKEEESVQNEAQMLDESEKAPEPEEPEVKEDEIEAEPQTVGDEETENKMQGEDVEAFDEELPITEEEVAEKSLTAIKQVSMAAVEESTHQIEGERSALSVIGSKTDTQADEETDLDAKREKLEKKKLHVLGSVISIRRGDATYYDRSKISRFQNSYKLDSDKPFNSEKVQTILQEVLEEALLDLTYDHDKIPKQAKWASSAIRAKVKELDYDRYKIICYVTIGEKLCQDIFVMLRFLWDAERDNYALHVHENLNLFAIALCFGIYYE